MLSRIDAFLSHADCGTYAHAPSTTHSSSETFSLANFAMMSGGERGLNS